MVDHPIDELKDMRTELWPGRRKTRLAIILCTAAAVIFVMLFALISPVAYKPAYVANPVQEGASTAFKVIPPSPTETKPSAGAPAPQIPVYTE